MSEWYPDPIPADPDARARIAAWERGELAPDEVLIPETHQLPVAPLALPSVDDLVRIATDAEPDAASYGPDVVLGPLADEADPWTLRTATAWAAWITADGGELPPLTRFARDKSLPRAVRASLFAAARAPLAPWRIRATDGVHAELEDLAGLGIGAPSGPVRWRAPATPFGPPRAGGGLLTAIGRGPEGWEMVAPFAVPAFGEWLGEWLAAEVRAARVLEPTVQTMADVLRLRGACIARRAITRWWADG